MKGFRYLVISNNKRFLGTGRPDMFGKVNDVLTSDNSRAYKFESLEEAEAAKKEYKATHEKVNLSIYKFSFVAKLEDIIY